ncbi:MAG: glycosyltransferase family 4 protein [Pseudomonadota bacterium]|nr:glycosyltransferase family 4 protein [Pseudomonadota bacterium]
MSVRKILHVTYDMNIGGTEQVIRNLVLGLDRNRFESSILCIDGDIGPWGRELQQQGIEHYCFQRQPGFDLKLIRQIRQLVRSGGFDLIHAHQYSPYTYGWFGSVFTGVPIIFTEHGRFYPDFGTRKRKLINPLLQTRTAAITAISDATRQALVAHENFSESKIQVIYNGIADSRCDREPALAESLDLSPDNVVLGTISRLDPIKNQPMMIRAFAQCLQQHPQLRLLIVGDGPQRGELEALVEELDLAGSVIFTGFQPNPQRYLALMDVFLLPSFSEGTSMTLLEAMCFGKPSIVTAVGGSPEIIQNGISGVVIENDSEVGLTEAIDNLVIDQSLRQLMGEGARASYEKLYSLGKMVVNYENLYEQLIE